MKKPDEPLPSPLKDFEHFFLPVQTAPLEKRGLGERRLLLRLFRDAVACLGKGAALRAPAYHWFAAGNVGAITFNDFSDYFGIDRDRLRSGIFQLWEKPRGNDGASAEGTSQREATTAELSASVRAVMDSLPDPGRADIEGGHLPTVATAIIAGLRRGGAPRGGPEIQEALRSDGQDRNFLRDAG